jgi:hypothetical protein
MKHILGYYHLNEDNNLFNRITGTELNKYHLTKTWDKLQPNIIKEIESNIKNIKWTPYIHGDIRNKKISDKNSSNFLISEKWSLCISEDIDEYFLVVLYFPFKKEPMGPSYWICDQLEGLLSFLTYIKKSI